MEEGRGREREAHRDRDREVREGRREGGGGEKGRDEGSEVDEGGERKGWHR